MALILDFSSSIRDGDDMKGFTSNHGGEIPSFSALYLPPLQFYQPNGIFHLIINHCFLVHKFGEKMCKSICLPRKLLTASIPLLALEYLSIVEKKMSTHSSILAWKIPWMEEPSRL